MVARLSHCLFFFFFRFFPAALFFLGFVFGVSRSGDRWTGKDWTHSCFFDVLGNRSTFAILVQCIGREADETRRTLVYCSSNNNNNKLFPAQHCQAARIPPGKRCPGLSSTYSTHNNGNADWWPSDVLMDAHWPLALSVVCACLLPPSLCQAGRFANR